MGSYGGYTKTYGGDEGGGFMAGSQQGSQSGGRNYQDETLRPLTIKQVLDADTPDQSDFRIDGTNVTQVTLVGQIRSINAAQTNMTLRLDDGTGLIDVKKYVEPDKQDEASAGLELDSWVRIYGNCKSFNNKHFVNARVVRPIADYNEVNYHMLEVAVVHLHYTRGLPGGAGGDGGNDSMFVDGGNGAGQAPKPAAGRLVGAPPDAVKMFEFLNSTPGGNEGVHLNVISSGTRMTVQDVLAAANWLYSSGIIYPSVDDETWAILDC